MNDADLIAKFMTTRGVKRVPIGASAFTPRTIRNCNWAKGKHFSPRHRYNLAISYARRIGSPTPIWTDVLEAELLRLRALGRSYREIGKAINRTKNQVQARARYLALGRRLKREK